MSRRSFTVLGIAVWALAVVGSGCGNHDAPSGSALTSGKASGPDAISSPTGNVPQPVPQTPPPDEPPPSPIPQPTEPKPVPNPVPRPRARLSYEANSAEVRLQSENPFACRFGYSQIDRANVFEIVLRNEYGVLGDIRLAPFVEGAVRHAVHGSGVLLSQGHLIPAGGKLILGLTPDTELVNLDATPRPGSSAGSDCVFWLTPLESGGLSGTFHCTGLAKLYTHAGLFGHTEEVVNGMFSCPVVQHEALP